MELEERLLERKLTILRARQSLTDWARVCGYEPALHHKVLIEALERLATGRLEKLMVFMPPGSAKSTYGSQLFPAWFLSQFPNKSVLGASHSEDLAERFGRRTRNLIEVHKDVLGIDTDPSNRSAGRWQLAPRPNTDDTQQDMGEYLAAGVGSAIAGFRGDLGIIDDPVKSRESVTSELMRQRVWEWYQFDFKPRLKPGARQVLIMTRWHEDDLAGRLLLDEPDEWELIKLPMVAEDEGDILGRAIGERLWPDWFTEKMVADAAKDPNLWLSLYQQRPTTEGGTFWRREWLHPVPPTQVPPRTQLRVYGGSDYAVTAASGDYTVHAVIGLDPEDRPWLLDLWRERTSSDVWIEAWCEMVNFWKPMMWGEERGQIISGVGPYLERRAREKRAFTERIQFVSRNDKGVRAQSIRGHIATHGLWYGSDLPYRSDLEAELLAFPAGKHDDIHDALGQVGQILDVALKGKRKEKPKPVVTSGYKAAGERVQTVNMKVM